MQYIAAADSGNPCQSRFYEVAPFFGKRYCRRGFFESYNSVICSAVPKSAQLVSPKIERAYWLEVLKKASH